VEINSSLQLSSHHFSVAKKEDTSSPLATVNLAASCGQELDTVMLK